MKKKVVPRRASTLTLRASVRMFQIARQMLLGDPQKTALIGQLIITTSNWRTALETNLVGTSNLFNYVICFDHRQFENVFGTFSLAARFRIARFETHFDILFTHIWFLIRAKNTWTVFCWKPISSI